MFQNASRPIYQALLLILSLKFELEDSAREIGTVKREIKRWCNPGMHGKRMVAFVVVTDETLAEFMTRMKPMIDQLSNIENFWCMVAPKPDDIVGQNGFVDAICHRIRLGWVEAGERNQPRHMRNSQRFQRRV